MTEEVQPDTVNSIQTEVQKQLQIIKDEHKTMMAEKDAIVAEKDALIASLQSESQKLHSELIRKTVFNPLPEEQTAEEKYNADVNALAIKAKKYAKQFM